MIRIAVFASGSGSNAEALVHHLRSLANPLAEVVCILSDKADAGVLARASRLGIPAQVVDKATYTNGVRLAQLLRGQNIDLVVLAGYLKRIPSQLVDAYPKRIINLHPSLLPKYGGKGMYGAHVHQAVLAAEETQSGITIHYVNEAYDEGEIILQVPLNIAPDWTPADLQAEIHQLEHRHFPVVVEKICAQL